MAVAEIRRNRSQSATPQGERYTGVYPLDRTDWLLNVDPSNQGREQGWATEPTRDAKPTKVPWVIQDAFPDYHGVAWYWRDFNAPPNPHHDGRYLLRFQAVDYPREVWVNGIGLVFTKAAKNLLFGISLMPSKWINQICGLSRVLVRRTT